MSAIDLLTSTEATDFPSNPNIRFIKFNQDFSSFIVGTEIGFKLFSIIDDRAEQIYSSDVGPVLVVERLFSSSLLTVVTEALPRRLQVCHFKKETKVCEYDYTSTIVAIRLNRTILVVVLEEALFIHNIRDMELIHTIKNTPLNSSGVCDLCMNSACCYLAYLGSTTCGEVQIFDAINLQAYTMLPAHETPIAALSFNSQGSLLSTASERGTVIRVFSVRHRSKLYELRRGLKRCARIFSMVFSMDSQYLAVCSNTETVHIFKLCEHSTQQTDLTVASSSASVTDTQPHSASPSATKQQDDQSWLSYFNKAVSVSASYLPGNVSEVFNQDRAFSVAYLPVSGLRSVCGLVMVKKQLVLLVALTDGVLYMYNVDTTEGGDCNLARQYRLDTSKTESDSSSCSTGSYNNAMGTSYASVVRGKELIDVMSESEKMHEMCLATEPVLPPGPYTLSDETQFPPM